MPAALSLRNVRVRYGDTLALDGLSLDIGRGEVVGLLGPNGSGKTTMIRMLLGLIPVDRGSGEILDTLGTCLGEHFDVAHCTFQLEPEGHRAHEPVQHR